MKEQKKYESKFMRWGERNYVQGGHMVYQLFDAVKEWKLGEINSMAASFRSKLHEQGTYSLFKGRPRKDDKENLCATFKLNIKGHEYYVGLKGNEKALDEVIPDDEKELILNGKIIKNKKFATIMDFSANRFVNVIIALNKKLHLEIIIPEGFGPWILVQLNLHFKEINLFKSKDMSIFLSNNIGNKMTRSIIKINGMVCGDISFKREALS